MIRWWIIGLVMALGSPAAFAAPPSSTSTVAATTLSPEDLDLARYLGLLENWELVQELEMLELLPLLEEDDES